MKGKLLINPIGGLANRMRTLAGGISLANELGVDFRVIWLKNWEIAASFDDVFELPACLEGHIEVPGNIRYSLCYSIPRKKNLWVTSLSLRKFGLSLFDCKKPLSTILEGDNSNEKLKEMVKATLWQGKDCFIQGGTNIYDYSVDTYRGLFVLRRELQAKVDSVMARLGDDSVGVHIRRTDNLESIKHSPESLFEREMEKTIADNPSVKFYLATDSDDVKSYFTRKFEDKVITCRSTARRDTKDGIMDAAVEMYVLSRTKKILGSYYSSFSEAAAMLGGCPLETVRL